MNPLESAHGLLNYSGLFLKWNHTSKWRAFAILENCYAAGCQSNFRVTMAFLGYCRRMEISGTMALASSRNHTPGLLRGWGPCMQMHKHTHP